MNFPVLGVIDAGGLSSIDKLFIPTIISSEVSSGSLAPILHIQCKYYRANITVKEIDTEQDLTGTEAVIIYFDASKESSWQHAQRWMNAVDQLELPLRLLVCTRVPLETHSNFEQSHVVPCFHRLAIEQEFELIELDPHEDSVEEGEEFGVHRIKSALEAHMWSNMELLDPSLKNPDGLSVLAPTTTAKTDVTNTNNRNGSSGTTPSAVLANHSTHTVVSQSSRSDGTHSPEVDRDTTNESLSEEQLDLMDEQSIDSFERAFRTIMSTRDRVSKLNQTDRRKLAEKLTFQLWRAVGGSPDEIDGLSEDSSDDQQTV